MELSDSDLDVVFKLLGETSTTKVVKDYLSNLGLPHSGTWEELRDQRVRPRLRDGKIKGEDLLDLLRDAEEHGAQHVFLFRCDRSHAHELLDPSRINRLIRKYGVPRIMDEPGERTVSDIRMTMAGKPEVVKYLIVKSVDVRKHLKVAEEHEDEHKKTKTVVYDVLNERSVCVARLSRDGILEVRIGSRRSSSNYEEEMVNFRKFIQPIISGDFGELSLQKAKYNIYQHTKLHDSLVSLGTSRALDDAGFGMTITGPDHGTNISDNQGSTDGIDAFLREKDAFLATSNVWWEARSGLTVPSRRMHTRLSGHVNEFSITAHCNKEDYEYVFEEIKRHNK